MIRIIRNWKYIKNTTYTTSSTNSSVNTSDKLANVSVRVPKLWETRSKFNCINKYINSNSVDATIRNIINLFLKKPNCFRCIIDKYWSITRSPRTSDGSQFHHPPQDPSCIAHQDPKHNVINNKSNPLNSIAHLQLYWGKDPVTLKLTKLKDMTFKVVI